MAYLICGSKVKPTAKIDAARRFETAVIKEEWVIDSVAQGTLKNIRK